MANKFEQRFIEREIYRLSGLSDVHVNHASSLMRLLWLFTVAVGLSACGPDLNSPGQGSVTGKWQTPDSVSFFSDVKLDLAQSQQGDITGSWTGRVKGGNLTCPVSLPTCAAANEAFGRNTVVGISIEVLGVGKFTGQLEGGKELHGDISRFDGNFKVKFTRLP